MWYLMNGEVIVDKAVEQFPVAPPLEWVQDADDTMDPYRHKRVNGVFEALPAEADIHALTATRQAPAKPDGPPPRNDKLIRDE